jgi:hypothetical protein
MSCLPSRAVMVCTMWTLIGLSPMATATVSNQEGAGQRTALANAPCPGDCDGSGGVTIDEIIRGIDLALGNLPVSSCQTMDTSHDGKVTIDELLRAVNSALVGCPTPMPTTTATSTATATAIMTSTTTPSLTTTTTQTSSATPTATATPSVTATATSTATATPTVTHSATFTRTATPTSSVPATPTASRTGTPTETPTTVPEDLSIRVGSATGQPGERVTIGITLHTGGETIVATQNQILLDVRAPIAARGTRPSCTVNPAIEKDGTVFAFLPPECAAGGSCELIRAIVISFGESTAIPDGSVLYTCAVDIAPSATPGDVVPLVCSDPVASGPRGEFLAPLCINGEISVGAPVP